MSRKIICGVILVLGIVAALALGGIGIKLKQPVYTEDDIVSVCDINTCPFEKNTDERLVLYDFSDDTAASSIVFHARTKTGEQILQRITLYAGDVKRSAYIYFPEGAEYAFVPVPDGKIEALEMHETMQTIADAIEFHTNALVTQPVPVRFRFGYLAAALAVTIAAALLIWHTAGKNEAESPVAERISATGQFPAASGGLIKLAVVAVILIVSVSTAKFLPGIAFSRRALAIYLAGMLLALYSLWIQRKEIVARTERVFLCTSLILGAVLLLVSPVGHGGWDADMHYKYALQASGGGSSPCSLAELLLIENMPDAAVDELPAVNRLHEELLEDYDGIYAGEQKGAVYLTHLPSGVGLAAGRMFGLGFAARFRLGEAMNLLVYVLLSYFAIRRLHSGKVLLTLLALIPTNLFLATTYGYDYWVLGFLFLGVAYFIGMRQEGEKPVSIKDVCVMSFSLSLACILKQNYLPVTLLAFFMPKKKLKQPLRYYLLCVLPVLLLGGSLLLRSQDVAKSGGDLRGGSVDAAAQLSGIFVRPVGYAKVLITELFEKLSPLYYCKAVTNYGEFGYCDVTVLSLILLVLLIGASLIDRDVCDEGVRGWKLKIFAFLNVIGGVALILTAFYLVYTPVGAQEIKGVQARYFTPLIYPLLAVIGTGGRRFFGEKPLLRSRYLFGAYLAEVLLFFGTAVMILVRA